MFCKSWQLHVLLGTSLDITFHFVTKQDFLYTYLVPYFSFASFKILTTVLQTPVKMVEHVRMESTATRVFA